MLDFYSLEQIAKSHMADAEKIAAREHLASKAEAVRRGRRPAMVRSLVARLRALVPVGVRRFETPAGSAQG